MEMLESKKKAKFICDILYYYHSGAGTLAGFKSKQN